jgi:hypothetical protein
MSPRLKATMAFPAVATIFTLLLMSGGCSQGPQSDSSTSEHGPPWVTIRDDKIGSSSSGGALGKDGKPLRDKDGRFMMSFSIENKEFVDLLEEIASRFEVSIVVRPKELASRGITVEVTGADAQAALEDVARQCNLQLERLGDKKWRLAAPNSENAPEETIAFETE